MYDVKCGAAQQWGWWCGLVLLMMIYMATIVDALLNIGRVMTKLQGHPPGSRGGDGKCSVIG